MTNPKQIVEVMTIRKLQKELDKTKEQLFKAKKQIKLIRKNMQFWINAGMNGKD